MTPAVSVLMPCRDAAATLDEAMASLAGQTLRNIEIVAVDDGSEDDTLARLRAWAARDPRVAPIQNASASGIVGALNAGLARCRADLIARMDADDIAHPERLARQASWLAARPDLAGVSCRVEVFGSGDSGAGRGWRRYVEWINSLLTPEDIDREFFVESPLPHPSMVVRREWLLRMGGYREMGWPEDYDLWLRMRQAGARFGRVAEVLLRWRDGPARLSRTDARYSADRFLRIKAHFLAEGPLRSCDGVFIWGAGRIGPRLARCLEKEGCQPAAFVDIDPKKIGRMRRGRPVISPRALPGRLSQFHRPVVLASVGSEGAREEIRNRLLQMGMREGTDWLPVA